MKLKSFLVAKPQPAEGSQRRQPGTPQPLDARDVAKVAGGLPRGGGGWAAPLTSDAVAANQLPRGGGGW